MPFDLSTAKPDAGKFDLSTAKPVEAPADNTEQGSSLLGPAGRGLFSVAEAAAEMGSSAIAKPVSDVAGLAAIPLHAGGVIKKDPAAVKRSVQGMTYEPKTEGGKAIAEYNPLALLGKVLQWGGKTARSIVDPAHGEGGAQAGVGQAVEELVNQLPALFGARGSVPKVAKKEPAPKPAGVGAEKAVDELQRQSVASESPKRGEVGLSARENAKLELDEATKPMREAAFNSPAKVNMAEPLSLIERMKSQTNNPSVVKALDQAKAIIEDGIEKSKPKAPASGRMSAAEFKTMNAEGAQGTMPVKMLDETRQAINDIVKEAHGPFAQKELLSLQESMLKFAPKEYQKYLAEYAQRAQKMEPFKAAGGAMGKVTTDPAAFSSLNAADKRALLNKAFEGDTPGRTLTELVRDTEHNPQALQSVRESYTEWLQQPDPLTKMPPTKALVKRWEETKAAAKSSKLLSDEHYAAIDKAMDEISQAATKDTGRVKKAWASTGGFIAGGLFGHPIVGAHMARDTLSGASKAQNVERAVVNAMAKIAATPEGAAALAAPPTPANIQAVRSMLPRDVATMLVTPEAQEEQRRSQPKPKRPISELITPRGSTGSAFQSVPFTRG